MPALALCRACGQRFFSLQSFDQHRTGTYATPGARAGTRRCMSLAEMHQAGLVLATSDTWHSCWPGDASHHHRRQSA